MTRESERDSDRASDPRFVDYYAEESTSDRAIARFAGTKKSVLRLLADMGEDEDGLKVLDIGCNAGTQTQMWARDGHKAVGIDISTDLIDLARTRAADEGLDIEFCVGSATELPSQDQTFDVCLLPELLEHVSDWESCLNEACRVLRPGGALYLSTTNLLCPVQQEFDLPGYSWYPRFLKKHFEHVAVTTRPELVNYATHPAVHWFTYYQLRKYLGRHGLVALDRFEMIDSSQMTTFKKVVVSALKSSAILRFLGHIATSYTVVFAYRDPALNGPKQTS